MLVLRLNERAGALDFRHQRFALGARAVFVGDLAPRGGLARARDERRAGQTHAQHLGVGDRSQVDGAPRLDRQPRELRLRLLLDLSRYLARGIHRKIRDRRCGARRLALPRDRAALEVVPNLGEARVRRIQFHHALARCDGRALRGIQARFDFLAARKLAAVVLGDVRAALAFLELPRKLCHELLDELAPELPQTPQLVEHQRRKAALGKPEPRFEHPQHLLRAQGCAFLLFDAVFETIDLVLQRGVGLFQLRAVAKQRKHAVILRILHVATDIDLEQPELAQCIHDRCGSHRPTAFRRAKQSSRPR